MNTVPVYVPGPTRMYRRLSPPRRYAAFTAACTLSPAFTTTSGRTPCVRTGPGRHGSTTGAAIGPECSR
jgi:hypothetical protein